jgi:GTP pyrophosphokinase
MLYKSSFSLELEKGYQRTEILKFEKALDLIRPQLIAKKRLAGDNFYEHNLRVGAILMENKAEPDVVIAGLLHGTLDLITEDEVKKDFGENVFNLVKGVKELQDVKINNEMLDAEALRKILITTINDVRIIFVKLANKLDNLNSVHIFPPQEQEKMAQEVLEVYAPLAYRLGMEKLRMRLEDSAFKVINPEKYLEIVSLLEKSREYRENEVELLIEEIKEMSKGKLKLMSIKGRPKHVYSIYRKMESKEKEFDNVYDLLGLRVIVPEEKDCYALLGMLHEAYEPVEGRLKDYIANPKPNFYRSLHTGIKLKNERVFEVQIRTPEMDEFAEEGLAAHWRYKKMNSDEAFERKIAWLRSVFEMKTKEDFLDTVKVDLFGDKIYCYTPKGDVKELPKGATVLDFAYTVHEELGNKCVGGRVNGKFVPLKNEIKQGDVVEVMTHKLQKPRRGWMKIATSIKARQKIKRALKEQNILPALYMSWWKPRLKEGESLLVESPDHKNAECILAKCCNALPGEEIKGIPTKKKIISIHKADCKQISNEAKRWVKVGWKNSFSQQIQFYIEAAERRGMLAELLHTIASAGFEVKEAKGKFVNNISQQCSFKVVPRDLEHLKDMVQRVQKVRGVRKVWFE